MFLRANERNDSPPSDQHDVQHILNLDREPPSTWMAKMQRGTFIFDTGTRTSAALDRTDGSNLRNCSEDRLIAMSPSNLRNSVYINGSAPNGYSEGFSKIINPSTDFPTSQQPAQIEIRPSFKHLLELLSRHDAEDLQVKVVKVQSRLPW